MKNSTVRSLPEIAADTSDIESHGDDLVHKYCPRCNPVIEPGSLITRLCGTRGLAAVGHDGKGVAYGPQCSSCMAVRTSGQGCPTCGYVPPSGS